jgi:hypothetical protein
LKLVYTGNKCPWTFKMPWLSKEYTFGRKPVDVENEDAAWFLNNCPADFKVHGKVESVFPGSEDDEPIVIGDEKPDKEQSEEENADDQADGEFSEDQSVDLTCEKCGKTYKRLDYYTKHVEACDGVKEA